MTVTLRRLLFAGLAILLASCARSSAWELHDVSGLLPPLRFSMTDQDGREVSAADYRGKILAVYFGYTHCTDACPVTLRKLADAVHRLGPSASQVRILFVTVDPQRDTVPVLKRYATGFGPEVVGLHGTDATLRSLAKRYRVTYTRAPGDMHDMAAMSAGYDVSHSEGIFIFGPDGNARLLATPTDGADKIAHDLRRLVAGEG